MTRSARLGAVYKDATHLLTPDLERRIDAISGEFPGFYFGRFDVRFEKIDSFLQGDDFKIVEVNGAGAEMLHIWDGATGLRAAYRALWWQYRSLFAIAHAMRAHGHRPVTVRRLLQLWIEQESLRRTYPSSM